MKRKLIVLYSRWCPKCNMMMPVVDEIEELYQGRVSVIRIDIEKETKRAKDYGIQIVPTFVIIEEEKEIARMAGMIGEETLKRRLDAIMEQ